MEAFSDLKTFANDNMVIPNSVRKQHADYGQHEHVSTHCFVVVCLWRGMAWRNVAWRRRKSATTVQFRFLDFYRHKRDFFYFFYKVLKKIFLGCQTYFILYKKFGTKKPMYSTVQYSTQYSIGRASGQHGNWLIILKEVFYHLSEVVDT